MSWRRVQVLDGKPQFVELAGNLAPVSKSGDQASVSFRAFRENRLPLVVRVRDATRDAGGRLAFVPESRAAAASDLVVSATCTLNITLPDYVPGVGTHADDDELPDRHSPYTQAAARPGALTRLTTADISVLTFGLLLFFCGVYLQSKPR